MLRSETGARQNVWDVTRVYLICAEPVLPDNRLEWTAGRTNSLCVTSEHIINSRVISQLRRDAFYLDYH